MNNFTASSIIKNQISHTIFNRITLDEQSSTMYIQETLKNDKKLKNLFKNINLKLLL